MTARTFTPDRVNAGGSRTVTMKRACNGCAQLLGDVADHDFDLGGNLTDVRGECDHCRPLVEAEAAGCRTWEVNARTIAGVDRDLDRLDVYAKAYWESVDGKLKVTGLRVGHYPDHVVARFGDWLIRHPDGTFTVHAAPERVPE